MKKLPLIFFAALTIIIAEPERRLIDIKNKEIKQCPVVISL